MAHQVIVTAVRKDVSLLVASLVRPRELISGHSGESASIAKTPDISHALIKSNMGLGFLWAHSDHVVSIDSTWSAGNNSNMDLLNL